MSWMQKLLQRPLVHYASQLVAASGTETLVFTCPAGFKTIISSISIASGDVADVVLQELSFRIDITDYRLAEIAAQPFFYLFNGDLVLEAGNLVRFSQTNAASGPSMMYLVLAYTLVPV